MIDRPKVVPPLFRARPAEQDWAIEIANKILDRPGDPDADLALLARQFLRALERLGEYLPPGAWGPPWRGFWSC
jgi:hypothetical protein